MLSRTQLEICVRYDAPVMNSRRVLRVLPLRRAGQTILSERWKADPKPDLALEKADEQQNRRLLFRHRRIETEFRFGLEIEVETDGAPFFDVKPNFARWKMPSRAARFTPELQNLTREARHLPPLERARHFAQLCESRLSYNPQTSPDPASAEKVWARRHGNCADFTHVFLALCRCSGLPARYVAGFNATQGQMHAWAEVWSANHWHAFDPTLGRQISAGSIAVVVGRDYFDCAPHIGNYRGTSNTELKLWCYTRSA